MTLEKRKLRLGSATIQRLLPHRSPMLFVDFVAAYERTPRPTLRAGCHISANDRTFAGHFPELGMWPGIYTVEGLNQACSLLATISALEKEWQRAGREPGEVLDGLRQLDQSFELKPAIRNEGAASVMEMVRAQARTLGLSAGIDVRFTAPVFPGCRLDYTVAEVHSEPAAMIFEVEAAVEGSGVARGRLTLSRGRQMPAVPA